MNERSDLVIFQPMEEPKYHDFGSTSFTDVTAHEGQQTTKAFYSLMYTYKMQQQSLRFWSAA